MENFHLVFTKKPLKNLKFKYLKLPQLHVNKKINFLQSQDGNLGEKKEKKSQGDSIKH